jgi:hypothetical protein
MRQLEVDLEKLENAEDDDLKKIGKNLFVRLVRTGKLQIVELDDKDDTRSWWFIVRKIQWVEDKEKSCIEHEYLVVKEKSRMDAIQHAIARIGKEHCFKVEPLMVISLPDLANLGQYDLGHTIIKDGYRDVGNGLTSTAESEQLRGPKMPKMPKKDDLEYVGSLVLKKEALAGDVKNNPNFVCITNKKTRKRKYHKIVDVLIDNSIVTEDGLEIRIEDWKRKG